MQGHHDIEKSLQQGSKRSRGQYGFIMTVVFLTIVLSVAFRSEAPRQVFATRTACAGTTYISLHAKEREALVPRGAFLNAYGYYTTVNGTTTNNAASRDSANKLAQEEQRSCTASQYALYLESFIGKVPRHPALSSTKTGTASVQQEQKTPKTLWQGGRVPTPTPTPIQPTPTPQLVAPTPAQAGGGSVEAIIEGVFGSYAAGAIQVATCESGLNPSAVNPTSIGGSNATGLFQILYPSTWDTTSQAGASPYEATANAIAAHDIFVRDGYSWREWTCQP